MGFGVPSSRGLATASREAKSVYEEAPTRRWTEDINGEKAPHQCIDTGSIPVLRSSFTAGQSMNPRPITRLRAKYGLSSFFRADANCRSSHEHHHHSRTFRCLPGAAPADLGWMALSDVRGVLRAAQFRRLRYCQRTLSGCALPSRRHLRPRASVNVNSTGWIRHCAEILRATCEAPCLATVRRGAE